MIERVIDTALNWFKISSIKDLDVVGLVQIFILLVMALVVYFKLIKNTASEKLVNGIFSSIVFLWVLSGLLKIANLSILSSFLQVLVFTVILSLIVIFQPELRRFMGYLGQRHFWDSYIHKKITHESDVDPIKEILEAVKYLKKTKTGALMVLQGTDIAAAYTEVGTKLNATVSTPLILTIFHPNTALHDGAIVIKDDVILSAGVLLPLTDDPKLSWKYGTRHRAAIGMSEVSDCACLVVSEETGDVSIAVGGALKKYDDFTILKADLENLTGYASKKNTANTKFSIFGQTKINWRINEYNRINNNR